MAGHRQTEEAAGPPASDSVESGGVTVVGIAGGTGSGKSTLGRRLMGVLGAERCALVTQDNYYRDLAKISLEARGTVNFDHPDSIDAELLVADIAKLKSGEAITMPRYDFSRHTRASGGAFVAPRPIVIVEGILVLVWPELCALLDLKIYVDAPADIRLARRVRRDIVERGRDVDSVLDQYLSTVRPMHDRYAGPSIAEADLVVPGSGDNLTVVRMLARGLGAPFDGRPLRRR